MAHSLSQCSWARCQHLQMLDNQLEIIEDSLCLESHCLHCPCPDRVETRDLERGPSGWTRWNLVDWRLSEEEMEEQVCEDEDYVCRELGELEGGSKTPYYYAPPGLLSYIGTP